MCTDMGMRCLQSKDLDDLVMVLAHPAAFESPFTQGLAEWAGAKFPARFRDLNLVRIHYCRRHVALADMSIS